MIAAAVVITKPWWHNLSFNWFDIVVVLVLGFGFWRGRKRGMSREAWPVILWLVLVIAAGLGYQFIGNCLLDSGLLKSVFHTAATARMVAFILSYLLIAVVVGIFFAMLGKPFREKISGSNAFGGSEYYLGMGAGVIRYACILIFALALIHAPYYSSSDIAAMAAYDRQWYGGGSKDKEMTGKFIPHLSDIQAAVFKDSFMGPVIWNNVGYLLITTTGSPPKKGAGPVLH